MSADGAIPELSDRQEMPWRAVTSDLREMGERVCDGTATTEDTHAALNRLISCDIDPETLCNTLCIPPDAGRYAEALERILRRIPDGWGRWISHDAGWYPIVANLDERLAAIDPDYVVHQVKEKFGALRYYSAPSDDLSTALQQAFPDVIDEAKRMRLGKGTPPPAQRASSLTR
ncbi:hypothetical protein A5760_16365 [Mycobacterium colombiense]|uniref:Uncharacterized protein n=1 Tax=Mycobacterium colombiense TaxID=339268 RepID=A0A1A0VDX7_9MYCO|nr:hypothetical protein [Mycobacterium colombiense]OBB81462.1 hypothetical protein A5760_16365 [Mycobacterium colombiense]